MAMESSQKTVEEITLSREDMRRRERPLLQNSDIGRFRSRIHGFGRIAWGKPPPARYRRTNWSSYDAALRKRGSMLIH